MAGIPGLGGLLNKVPVIGKALAEVAPVIQGLTSLTPVGAAANAALDVAGGAASGAIDATKTGQGSAINF